MVPVLWDIPSDPKDFLKFGKSMADLPLSFTLIKT